MITAPAWPRHTPREAVRPAPAARFRSRGGLSGSGAEWCAGTAPRIPRMPVPAMVLSFEPNDTRLPAGGELEGDCAATRGRVGGHAGIDVSRQDAGMGEPEPAVLGGAEERDRGRHRVEKSPGRRRRASVMWNHEDVGGQIVTRSGHERLLPAGLEVPGEKDAPTGAFDPDHARVGVVESRMTFERVQNLEGHPVPLPPAAGHARRVRPVGAHRAVRERRRDRDRFGEAPVSPGMVRVAVAQHHAIDRGMTAPCQIRQHREGGGVEAGADRRAGVVVLSPIDRADQATYG